MGQCRVVVEICFVPASSSMTTKSPPPQCVTDATGQPQKNPLERRSEGYASLSPAEREILNNVTCAGQTIPAGCLFQVEGQVQMPVVLLSGWACYQRTIRGNRRQIIHFLLPGDIVGSIDASNQPVMCSAMALTDIVIASAEALLPHRRPNRVEMPGLAMVIDRMARSEVIVMRDQIVRLGQQDARERVLHLALELYGRLQAVGQVEGNTFACPVTRQVLAGALGMSLVHLNRTLHQVETEGFMTLRSHGISIRQIAVIKRLVDWEVDGNWPLMPLSAPQDDRIRPSGGGTPRIIA
jgi:CRP-like cAMP-binding protein